MPTVWETRSTTASSRRSAPKRCVPISSPRAWTNPKSRSSATAPRYRRKTAAPKRGRRSSNAWRRTGGRYWRSRRGSHHHRRVVAGADLRQHLAGCSARRDRRGGEHVVEAPADVALAHVAPGRPPREHIRVVRIQLAANVDQIFKQRCKQLALLSRLADDSRLALARMHVHFGPRDVDVTAEHHFTPLGRHLPGPRDQLSHERHLGRVVLVAVGYVNR